MLAIEAVVGTGHSAETFGREDKHCLGSLEVTSGIECPGEIKRINSQLGAAPVVGIAFCEPDEVAAVNEIETVDRPVILLCAEFCERKKWIVMVTTGATAAFHRLDPRAKRGTADFALTNMRAEKMQE